MRPQLAGNITGLNERERALVRRALRQLRIRREDADYRPGLTIDRGAAFASLRDVGRIFKILMPSV